MTRRQARIMIAAGMLVLLCSTPGVTHVHASAADAPATGPFCPECALAQAPATADIARVGTAPDTVESVHRALDVRPATDLGIRQPSAPRAPPELF